MNGETIEPMGDNILFCKDEARGTTKGGIVLPDSAKIEVLTGRVTGISAKVESDPLFPLSVYDKVIVNPCNAVPVELDSDNKMFLIPVDDILGIIRKEKK